MVGSALTQFISFLPCCCFLQQEDLQYGSGFFLLLFHHSSGLVFSENKKRLYLSKKEITTSPIGIYPISLDSIHSSSITWYYTTIPKFKNKSPILALCHHYSRRCPLWCRNLFKICLCILASIRKNGSIRAGSRGIAWPWWNSLLPSNNIISLPEGASLPWRLKNHLSEVQTNRDHSWIKMKMCRNEGHPPRARAYLPRCTTAGQQRLLTPVLDSAKSLTLGDTYVLKLFGPKEISPLIGSNNGKS